MKNPVVFDVGANVGEWTGMLLAQGRAQVHAFEPCAETFEMLRNNSSTARLNRLALSDGKGWATMMVSRPGAGTNALSASGEGERVEVSTVDAYSQEHDIHNINLLKIDAEGYDLMVLRGASQMLQAKAIDVAQFEYNHRWMATRTLLKDAFEYLLPLGYEVGKLSGDQIQFYPGWTPEMETYREGNYVACLPAWTGAFKTVEANWMR